MSLKIDEKVLRKTKIFCEILDDGNRRKSTAPDLSECLRFEYNPPIPPGEESIINSFSGSGICFRGDIVFKHPPYKTPDLITGGILSETGSECVYVAECKFNAENPANNFCEYDEFNRLIADKFHVIERNVWDVRTQEKRYFVIFSQDLLEQALARMRSLKNELEGDKRSLVESFIICDLADFRSYFV